MCEKGLEYCAKLSGATSGSQRKVVALKSLFFINSFTHNVISTADDFRNISGKNIVNLINENFIFENIAAKKDLLTMFLKSAVNKSKYFFK